MSQGIFALYQPLALILASHSSMGSLIPTLHPFRFSPY